MTEHVLAAIDAAIDDWEVSDDAMRVTHSEAPPPSPARITEAVQVAVRQYAEAITEAMEQLRVVMTSPAMAQALDWAREEQARQNAPAHFTRSPVYSDNRPRHVTPYGPPPRRTHQ